MEQPHKPTNKVFFENLDGFRFIAFFLVFLHHAFAHLSVKYDSNLYLGSRFFFTINDKSGPMGVSFFFVLSGFLITYLLLKEENLFGRFELIQFYKRRILRIWPLYFIVIILGFLIFPIILKQFGYNNANLSSIWLFIFFLANYQIYLNPAPFPLLGVQWSIAIEEQFYLFWPLLLKFFKGKYFIIPILCLYFTSLLFKLLYQFPYSEFHTLFNIGDLAIGGILAYLCFFTNISQLLNKYVTKIQIGIFYLIGIFLLYFDYHIFHLLTKVHPFFWIVLKWHSVLKGSFYAIFFAFIILEQNFSNKSFYKMKKFKFISNLGIITYGLYLLHMVPIEIVKLYYTPNASNWYLFPPLALICFFCAIWFSKLSYKYYESYFLRLKKKYSTITT